MTVFWILSHLWLVFGFALAALVIAHVIRQRRSPSGTIAWLLVIVLLPYIGVPLYLMLGGRKMRRFARRKGVMRLPETRVSSSGEVRPLERLLRSYQIPGATTGNRVVLCQTGEESYAALVRLIEQAERSLWVTVYILHQDEVGEDIVDRLARRAAAGVRVRLLLDAVGSIKTSKRFLSPIVKAGGRVAFFMPMLHRPFRGRTNLRNHRKLVLMDEKRVLAGGANIASEYMGPVPKAGRWKDLMFILEGPAVLRYAEIFRSDWEFASGESLDLAPAEADAFGTRNGVSVQVIPSGPDVKGDPLYGAILTAIYGAKTRLWIVTPYFVPDEAMTQALTLAVHRGIDLRIIVPKASNHPMADLARGTYLREIQEAGGKILLFEDGMVHAKAMVMDDELAMIGSVNMDLRSLFLDYEVVVFIYSEPEIQEVAHWMERLQARSRSGVKKVGTLRDIGEGVVRMMAPLL